MEVASGIRPMIRFWLRRDVDYEAEIIPLIERVPKRSWARFIRDAIRLLYDLRYGRRTDVLLEMFPDIADRLGASANLMRSMRSLEKSVQRIDVTALLVQFEEIKTALKEAPVMMQTVGMTGQALTQQTFAMPTFEEDDAVVLKKDTRTDSASSFLEAALGLKAAENQQG